MLAELAVPVVDQVLAVILQQHAFIDIGDISYYLRHPPLMGIWRDSCDVNPACTKMDEKKDIVGNNQTEASPHFCGEEIGRCQHIHVIAEELPPGRFLLPLVSRG